MKSSVGVPALIASAVLVCGCGGESAFGGGGKIVFAGEPVPWEEPVPRAACENANRAETALQGQVPLVDRLSGRSREGYACNLELVGQFVGEGAEIQHASFENCSYYNTNNAFNIPGTREREGVIVVDVTDSANPVPTTSLTTPGMMSPWESLKANAPRRLLAAMHGGVPEGGPELDVYDLSQDCRQPKLLYTGDVGDGTHTGHEAEWTPDGSIYWGSSTSEYFAIDMADPSSPEYMLSYVPDVATTHGLSVSDDGSRTYFVLAEINGSMFANGQATNGFVIADTADIHARKPGAEVKEISRYTWLDGGEAQHTIPVLIGGKPFMVHADEFGSGGIGGEAAWAWACANDLPPWGMARLFDISDEANPKLASKLMLDINDPTNCPMTLPDNVYRAVFGYDSHYCAVDDPHDTKIVVCSWFVSGLRVFDVRDPYHPREVAYYIPPVTPSRPAGSGNNFAGICETNDWILNQARIRLDRNEIWFTSMCGGFQAVRFVKPLAELLGPLPGSS